MPKALGVLLLLAAPLFADDAPLVVAHLRDGSKVERKRPTPRGHIVEFREAPLVARGPRALTSYKDTFAHFRRDLGEVRSGGPKANAEPRITHEFYRLFHGVSVTLDETELARIRALPYVKAVYDDEPVEAFAGEDTEHVNRIGAPRFWSEWKTRGSGIVVAVIDTGVDATHPALAGKVLQGFDFVDLDDDTSDENGHGTHVAGIIAGEGSGVQGVAPDVKILPYRVLDKSGSGNSSNIILAMEFAADPNHDDDFSDHADVMNLSLGSRAGSADSPTSIAADSATQAGVVVCLSAGNTFGGQTIGSPAASRLAITVGASDASDQMPYWSSRGPAFPDLALKPEIAAPGVEIVSAKMGGGTIALSGTSMAAPHVSGAAALLLALHPDWTPARVKAALVASADPVNEEIMARGGGRLNVYAAGGSFIATEPAVVSFGNGTAGEWSKSRTVRVTNSGTAAQTYTATSTAPAGVTLTIDPPVFSLDAGASRDVVLHATISDAAEASVPTRSLGGIVSFRTGEAAAQVPWVAIDAAVARLAYEAPLSATYPFWDCGDGPSILLRYEADSRWMTLLPYRRCGLSIMSSVWQGERFGETSMLFETRDVAGDFQLERSPADSVHTIDLAGVDAEGALLGPESFVEITPYFAPYLFQFPPDSVYAFDAALTSTAFPLRINTVPEATITASQLFFDFPRHRVFAVHHEPLHGVTGNVTLRTLPSDLKHVRVNVAPQSNDRFQLQSSFVSHFDSPLGGMGGGGIPLRNGWRGDLYVTAATNPDAWVAPAFGTGWMRIPDPESDLWTAGIRWIDGRFVMSSEPVPSAGAYSVAPGETLYIGAAPLHGHSMVDAADNGFTVFAAFAGPAGEWSEAATRGFTFEIRDASGTVIGEGSLDIPILNQAGPRGGYRVAIRSGRVPTELALAFDSNREDSNPPNLTSLRILGEDGAITTGIAPGEHATLTFSARDFGIDSFTSSDVRAARAWWRADGGDWQSLAVPLSDGVYRADLPSNVFGGVDLRVEVEDASGNTATTTIDDAYSVGARRRGTRR